MVRKIIRIYAACKFTLVVPPKPLDGWQSSVKDSIYAPPSPHLIPGSSSSSLFILAFLLSSHLPGPPLLTSFLTPFSGLPLHLFPGPSSSFTPSTPSYLSIPGSSPLSSSLSRLPPRPAAGFIPLTVRSVPVARLSYLP